MSAKKKAAPKPAPKKPTVRKKKAVFPTPAVDIAPAAFGSIVIGSVDAIEAIPLRPIYRKQHGDGQWHESRCPNFPQTDFAERSTLPASPLCPLCPTA